MNARGDRLIIGAPSAPPALPAVVLALGIEWLCLAAPIEERLRTAKLVTIGDVVGSWDVSGAAQRVLGRGAKTSLAPVVADLRRHCADGRADWQGFWAARGIEVVGVESTAHQSGLTQLLDAVPALIRAALSDGRKYRFDSTREWTVIEGRAGLESDFRTLEELGGELGVTRERVRQIEKKVLELLRVGWRRGFRGATYRAAPELDDVIARLRQVTRELGRPLPEPELLALLGEEESPTGPAYRRLALLLELGGLVRSPGDGDRRPAIWARKEDGEARVVVGLADRLSRYLTEEDCGAFTPAELVVAVGPADVASPKAVAAVEAALALLPSVQKLADGRWQGRFQYLVRRGDQAARILEAADGPMDLEHMTRIINEWGKGRTLQVRNLANQMADDPRFVAIGKSGHWGLANRDQGAAVTIETAMRDVLRNAGEPLLAEVILERVRDRRPTAESSISIYLSMNDHFVRMPDGRWALAEWPEARRVRDQGRQIDAAELARVMAVAALKGRGGVMSTQELIPDVAASASLEKGRVRATLARHPSFRFESADDGEKILLVGEDTKRPRTRRKPTLADRIADIVRPFLAEAPEGERELREVVDHVEPQLGIVRNTIYSYLHRLPGVVRVDVDGRKLVRLASGDPGCAGLNHGDRDPK